MVKNRQYAGFPLFSFVLGGGLQPTANLTLKYYPLTMKDKWCWLPGRRIGTPGMVLFRRTWHDSETRQFRLKVSADHRYRLYYDGKQIGMGPSRSDLQHYRFEEYEITCEAGDHVLAAEVWVSPVEYRAKDGAWPEMHDGGGFLVSSDNDSVNLGTPGEWRCHADESWQSRPWSDAWDMDWLIPAPRMDYRNLHLDVGAWRDFNYDDSGWAVPMSLGPAYRNDELSTLIDTENRWWLEPDPLPPWERREIAIADILHHEAPAEIVSGRVRGSLPAEGKYRFLIDLGAYQTGFPRLSWQGGAGTARVAYAEKLTGNAIGGNGYADLIDFPAGHWSFEPTWYRSGRFLELEFTVAAPVAFELAYDFSAYPLKLLADIQGDKRLEAIWQVAWRTIRCCAHDHYEDCPYFEQFQYGGDSRLQALISYKLAGDDRLGRQLIEHFAMSQLPCGLTQSRYPSRYLQIIPGYSLFWVMTIADHYRYFADAELVARHFHGIEEVLHYFAQLVQPDGLVGPVGYWNFTDWQNGWTNGRTDRLENLPETIHSLLYAMALRETARLAAVLGKTEQTRKYSEQADTVLQAINARCLDHKRGLYRDVPDKPWFSQHVNALAIISGAAGDNAADLAEKLARETDMTQVGFYYSYYLFEAWRITGRADLIDKRLADWQQLVEAGYTTFPEVPLNQLGRSQCHGWSASPLLAIVDTVLGVTPAEDGWKRIRIAPNPGLVPHLKATLPVGQGRLLHLEIFAPEQRMRLRCDSPLPVVVQFPGCSPQEFVLNPGEEVECPDNNIRA